MPYFERKHCRLHYRESGSGETIVLLSDLGRSASYWMGFDQLLASDFNVITMDYRGFGESHGHVSWNLKISELAHDVIALLDEKKISTAHVVGAAFGGQVALALAEKFPKRIQTIQLMNTAVPNIGSPLLSRNAALTVLNSLFTRSSHLSKWADLALASSKREEKEAVQQSWRQIYEAEGSRRIATAKQILAWLRFSIGAHLPRINTPTQVIYGAKDQCVPIKNSMLVHANLPHSHLKMIKGGHELHVDSRNELAEAVKSFAKSQGFIATVDITEVNRIVSSTTNKAVSAS